MTQPATPAFPSAYGFDLSDLHPIEALGFGVADVKALVADPAAGTVEERGAARHEALLAETTYRLEHEVLADLGDASPLADRVEPTLETETTTPGQARHARLLAEMECVIDDALERVATT